MSRSFKIFISLVIGVLIAVGANPARANNGTTFAIMGFYQKVAVNDAAVIIHRISSPAKLNEMCRPKDFDFEGCAYLEKNTIYIPGWTGDVDSYLVLSLELGHLSSSGKNTASYFQSGGTKIPKIARYLKGRLENDIADRIEVLAAVYNFSWAIEEAKSTLFAVAAIESVAEKFPEISRYMLADLSRRNELYEERGEYPGNGEHFEGRLWALILLDMYNYDALKAYKVVRDSDLVELWQLLGAQINCILGPGEVHDPDVISAVPARIYRHAWEHYGLNWQAVFNQEFFYLCRRAIEPLLEHATVSRNVLEQAQKDLVEITKPLASLQNN